MSTGSVFEEILAWSGDRPEWLRDALRRIVASSELTDADITDLAALCKQPHGLSANTPASVALSEDHIPARAPAGKLVLNSVTHLSDVNALAPNAVLSFVPAGITIIYGDNGAGKSSFSRILRRAFRARGADEPVLANALSDLPAGPPTARIDFSVATDANSHVWKDGAAASPELSTISVFDSASAQVYVSEKTEVRFRPFGLDVIDRAAATCLRVKKVLEAELNTLRTQPSNLPDLAPTTEAGRLVASLTALTPPVEVDRLARLTADEEEKHATLSAVLSAAKAEDPKKKAADLTLKADRLRRLSDELRALSEALGEAQIRRLTAMVADARSANADARRFGDEFAKELSLPGVGSPEWTAMWESAKRYSTTQAFPTHEFPHVGEGAVCVLCQQELGDGAHERMTRFAEFALGEVRRASRSKDEAVNNARRLITDLIPGERNQDGIGDLQGIEPELSTKVNAFLAMARECRDEVAAEVAAPTPCTNAAPLAELEALATLLEQRADEFTRTADPAVRAASEALLAELVARKTLQESRVRIHAEIDRKAKINAYDQCIKDTETRALTKLGGDLTKKYVTDALTASFDGELKRLGFTAFELELKPAGAQRGQLLHKIQLKHATNAQLPKVVSEGESRCIALAAFMAEVTSGTSDSAIVFDDPVSSLDHQWRSKVARRLVEAAGTRQVIVFTHELAFLSVLLDEAEQRGVDTGTRTLTRDHSHSGRVEAGLPWNGLTTKKRIGVLRNDWVVAEKNFRTVGPGTYNALATKLYAGLRTTWERAVEEVLLNQVILRFRQSVETNRLKKIGDIKQADLEAIEKGMSKSSKWMGGHDQALALNEAPPEPDELKGDIDALESWVKSVETRRK